MEPIHTSPAVVRLTAAQPVAVRPEQADAARKEAERAAEQFETLMALQMIRSMQSSLDGGNMFGTGVSGDIYNGLAEWELARILTRDADFGIKQQLLSQLPQTEETQK